jgi:hypothetical protein
MSYSLYLRTLQAVEQHDNYFEQKRDRVGWLGLSSLQKITAALKRKDVQRAFGVLQAQFAIVRELARMWDKATLRQIMTACVIMHNMILEDEQSQDEYEDIHYEGVGQLVRPTPPEVRNRTQEFREFLQAHHNITNKQMHTQLQQDHIEHLWQHHPDMYQY